MSDIGNFYFTAQHQGRRAVIWISDNGDQGWRLMSQTPNWWPTAPGCDRGKYGGQRWGEQGNFTHCYAGDSKKEVFKIADLVWPPDIEENGRFLYKGFMLGDYWLELDPNAPKTRLPGQSANWQPIITNALLQATIRKFEEIQQEIIKIGIQAGLDTTSILDPTGLLSVAGATYAMRNGDYLGCAMSLLGIIPVVGKACDAAKIAQASGRLARLTERLKALADAIKLSARSTKEARITGQVVREEIQGTMIGKAVAATKDAGGARVALTAGADLAKAAHEGGMALPDAKNLQAFVMDNQAIACVRYTAKESLVRQADVLNTGKPCELAPFHTAHGDSMWSGLIVVNKAQVADRTIVDAQNVRRLKGMTQYAVSDAVCAKTGDRLITRDGTAFYSDYDFMGMYHKTGRPYLDFKALNDDHGIVAFMNRLFPANGMKINHGMQDFFKRLKSGRNGEMIEVMGRQPNLEETFLFFEPTGKIRYVDLIDLKRLYSSYHIEWPYEIFGKWERLGNRIRAGSAAITVVTVQTSTPRVPQRAGAGGR